MGTKNLLGLPWRVALALQDDGWILRNAIVWHKPNAMPESVRDRLNCRHELIFLLVKSRHYWFDLDPIRIPLATPPGPPGSPRGDAGLARGVRRRAQDRHHPATQVRHAHPAGHRRPPLRRRPQRAAHPRGRNPGDVWSIPTRPYRGPHFAAFPVDIPTRAIAAGCPPGGMVLDPFCGTARQASRRSPSAAGLQASNSTRHLPL